MGITWAQFSKDFPETSTCLWEIGLDNNMEFNNNIKLSNDVLRELKRVEPLAEKLSAGQKEVFCTDEESVVNAMVVAYDLQPLHEFLNHAFDGVLTKVFYE